MTLGQTPMGHCAILPNRLSLTSKEYLEKYSTKKTKQKTGCARCAKYPAWGSGVLLANFASPASTFLNNLLFFRQFCTFYK